LCDLHFVLHKSSVGSSATQAKKGRQCSVFSSNHCADAVAVAVAAGDFGDFGAFLRPTTEDVALGL